MPLICVVGCTFGASGPERRPGGTETGINGVTVELLDSAFALLASDETELGGVYAFTVDDELGTYIIRETQPTVVDDGAAVVGDALDGIVISSNEMQLTLTGIDASDYDFTEIGQTVQTGVSTDDVVRSNNIYVGENTQGD